MKKREKASPIYLLSPAIQGFLMLAVLCVGMACESPGSSNKTTKKPHPKLIKTIGNPNYGNVQNGLQDKAGNYWFCTTENGLYKYDGKTFVQFLKADGLNSNNVYCLLEHKNGSLWIGTDAGLCVYDGKSFRPVKIPIPKHLPTNQHPFNQDKHGVHDMLQDRNGRVWLATMDGVYTYEEQQVMPDSAGFRHFAINKAPNGFMTLNDKVERMLEDREGNIWLGGRTNDGVYRFDGKRITKLALELLFQKGPKPKPTNWGWPQVQDGQGNIWFSNWAGVYRYDPRAMTEGLRDESIKSFSQKDGPLEGATNIIEDQKGQIWIGSADGLRRWDGKFFVRFSQKDGLANPNVWSVLEDKAGALWVGTRATGLYRFDGKRFEQYSAHVQD